jgi:hypothetical protein
MTGNAQSAPPAEAPSGLISAGHINRFQKRAAFHSRISYGLLFLVFVLFGFAAYIFLFAQNIDKSKTSLELFQEVEIAKSNQSDIVENIQTEVDLAKRDVESGYQSNVQLLKLQLLLIDAETQLGLLDEKERLMSTVGYFAPVDVIKSKEELTVQRDGAVKYEETATKLVELVQQQVATGSITVAQLFEPKRQGSEAKLKKEIIEQKLKTAPSAADIKVASTNIDTLELARTSLIRFGGVAVTLFLISVLVPIYRYNVRLASFYLARADTLLLARDTKVDNFGEMIALLTPTHAFEKEPQTPIDSVSSFIKDAAGIAKKASG